MGEAGGHSALLPVRSCMDERIVVDREKWVVGGRRRVRQCIGREHWVDFGARERLHDKQSP